MSEADTVSSTGPMMIDDPGQEPSRVLVVEPHPTLRTVLVQRLRQDGHLTAAVS
ncbi:MAG: DNA-binding response regulator, partial [Prochlorococcus sp.]